MRIVTPKRMFSVLIPCEIGNLIGFCLTHNLGATIGIALGLAAGIGMVYFNGEKVQ